MHSIVMVLHGTFIGIFSAYVILTVGYLSVQVRYAHRTHRATSKALGSTRSPLPSVDVIIPCFNETPEVLVSCLHSVAKQDYEGVLKVYVVDDGSRNRQLLQPIYAEFGLDERFTIIPLPNNVGKRKAQVAAIRQSVGDLVMSIDSDTVIEPDVVRRLAATMADPKGVRLFCR